MNGTLLDVRQGDCREVLRGLPDESVQCCVTSPPYFGLRDYGCAGQIGQEATPQEFVAVMVDVFREVRRVLKRDGTCWVNLGDSYSTKPCGVHGYQDGRVNRAERTSAGLVAGLKPKDLIGIPWRVAFALQEDGWYLRQDIIWSKPNPMPESVTDRCTKAHEYLFLLTKSERYYWDQEAILERVEQSSLERLSQANLANQRGSDRVPGKTNGMMKAVGRKAGNKSHKYVTAYEESDTEEHRLKAGLMKVSDVMWERRNKRSVWTVATMPYKEAHFATYPPELIKPCILAGTRPGDVVLDPFGGSGTTGEVALELGRRALLIELNPEYIGIIERRTDVTPGLALV